MKIFNALSIALGASAVMVSAVNMGHAAAIDFNTAIAPILAKHCNGCHGPEKRKGELDLARFGAASVDVFVKELSTWQSVAERVEAKDMPPEGKPQLSAAEIEALMAFADQVEGEAASAGRKDPGRVTLRRLNRTEYNNTIRDLLGIDTKPAQDFPSDDVGYGFDNIGDVLMLPPTLVERYLQSAERIEALAIVGEIPPKPHLRRQELETLVPRPSGGVVDGKLLAMPGGGSIRIPHTFPIAADYTFSLNGKTMRGLNAKDFGVVRLRLDGKDVGALTLATRNAAKLRLPVTTGPHRIDLVVATASNMPSTKMAVGLDAFVIDGPFVGKDWEPPLSHRRLIPRTPNKDSLRHDARAFLDGFASRAFRRPATAGEVERLARFVDDALAEGNSFEQGMRMALRAILVSPHFLFRPELDQADPTMAPPEVRSLNDWELASRLSYFLWSSMPDDELFALAAAGRLHEPKVLEQQVRRLLADARSEAFTESFAGQWLQTRSLASHRANRKQFPGFDDELKLAMARETELFFGEIMRGDLPLTTFLDADFSFMNERLARHYGIPDVMGTEFRKVSLAGSERGGILTQASILTVTSNPTRTSPVKRGRWVLEQLLGTPPPPPPPGVPELKEKEKNEKAISLRKRLEQHRADPSCAVCHKKMDPLGLGLENFDAVGAWRTLDGDEPIDPSGVLPSGQTFSGPRELKKILLSKEQLFRRNLATKLLTYALGRGVEGKDRAAIDAISERTEKAGNRFSHLVLAVVQSEPFLKRRVIEGAP